MYDTHVGMIYGFIGPIGGGKTFQLESLRQRNEKILCPFITSDFSDGIRSSVLNIFGVNDKGAVLEPSDERYSQWKESTSVIHFPTDSKEWAEYCFHNRDLLKNVGEYFKKLAGENVWARWTLSEICKQYWSLPNDNRKRECDIAFGSVRFKVEAEAVFNAAAMLEKQVKLIFCNFHEVDYNPDVHVSESLAHELISLGYEDGDDVTQAVKEIYNIK